MPSPHASGSGRPPRRPPAGPPPESTPPAADPLPRFPDHHLRTVDRFAVRWPAKQTDLRRFLTNWAHAYHTLSTRRPDHFVPETIDGEWFLRWLNDLYTQPISTFNADPGREVQEALEDVSAVVDAHLFLRRLTHLYPPRPRLWLFEWPPELPRLLPDQRRTLPDPSSAVAGYRRYDLDQLLGLDERTGPMAGALLGSPTEAQLDVLSRLEVFEDAAEVISAAAAERGIRDQLQMRVPVLARTLNCPTAEITEDRLAFDEVMERVQNWLASLSQVRPSGRVTGLPAALLSARDITVDNPAPAAAGGATTPGGNGDAAGGPDDGANTLKSSTPGGTGSDGGETHSDGPAQGMRFWLSEECLDMSGRKSLRYKLLVAVWDKSRGQPRVDVTVKAVARKLYPKVKGKEKDILNRLKSLCHAVEHDDFHRVNIPYTIRVQRGLVVLSRASR